MSTTTTVDLTRDYAASLKTFVAYALSIQPTPPEGFPATTIQVEPGRKYDRVVLSDPHANAFCFVRREDGAVLMAASWKAPAKHARGTIYTDNVTKYGITKYGPLYLK